MRWKLLLASFCTIWLIAIVPPVAADALGPMKPDGALSINISSWYLILAAIFCSIAIGSLVLLRMKPLAKTTVIVVLSCIAVIAGCISLSNESTDARAEKERERRQLHRATMHRYQMKLKREQEAKRNRERQEREQARKEIQERKKEHERLKKLFKDSLPLKKTEPIPKSQN